MAAGSRMNSQPSVIAGSSYQTVEKQIIIKSVCSGDRNNSGKLHPTSSLTTSEAQRMLCQQCHGRQYGRCKVRRDNSGQT